jgi:hypothetical protein
MQGFAGKGRRRFEKFKTTRTETKTEMSETRKDKTLHNQD